MRKERCADLASHKSIQIYRYHSHKLSWHVNKRVSSVKYIDWYSVWLNFPKSLFTYIPESGCTPKSFEKVGMHTLVAKNIREITRTFFLAWFCRDYRTAQHPVSYIYFSHLYCYFMTICLSYLLSSSWSDDEVQKDVVYFLLFNFAPSKGIDEIKRKSIKR